MLQGIGLVVASAAVYPWDLSKENEWALPGLFRDLYYCDDGANRCSVIVFSCRLLQLVWMNPRNGHVLDIQRKVGSRVFQLRFFFAEPVD